MSTTPALNHIVFKDALNMSEVKNGEAQLVIVTPPYLGHHGIKAKQNEKEFLEKLFAECARIVAPDGIVASINTDFRDKGLIYLRHMIVVESAKKAGLIPRDEKIWVRSLKTNLYRKKFSFILLFSKGRKVLQFPWWKLEPDNWILTKSQTISGFRDAVAPEIPEKLIHCFTRRDDLVVSACAGTGTVVIVALQQLRCAIGYEINPTMKEIIKLREKTIHKYYSPASRTGWLDRYILTYLILDDYKLEGFADRAHVDDSDIHYEELEARDENDAKKIALRRIAIRQKEYESPNGKMLMPLSLKRRLDLATIEVYQKPKSLEEKLRLLKMDDTTIQ